MKFLVSDECSGYFGVLGLGVALQVWGSGSRGSGAPMHSSS